MRQHIIGDSQVRGETFGDQRMRRLLAEKGDPRRDALVLGELGDVGCGLNAQRRNPFLANELEQIAVIAGDLDDARLGAEIEPLRAPSRRKPAHDRASFASTTTCRDSR